MKENTFAYYFSKKMRYIVFIGSQVPTIILTFMIAILCRSLMSLGYIIAAIYLMIRITDFFNLDQIVYEGKTW